MPKDARARDILPLKGTGEMAHSSKSRKSQVFSLRACSPVPFLATRHCRHNSPKHRAKWRGLGSSYPARSIYDRSAPRDLIALLALVLNSRPHMSQGSLGSPINGVLTGAAAPTSCVTLLSPVFETHTLPDASIARPSGLFRTCLETAGGRKSRK
jgi:hypothetical protein